MSRYNPALGLKDIPELETMYREHWEHSRHCEREIFWFTNIYAVVVAAILAFMKQVSSQDSGSSLVLVLVFFGFILSVFGLLIVIALTQGYHIYIMNIMTICYRWDVMEFYADLEKAFYYKRVHRWFFEFSIVLFGVLFLFYASQEWASLEVFHEFWILLITALVSLIIIKGLYQCIWNTYSLDCRDYKKVLRNDIHGYYRDDWGKWFKGPRFWKEIIKDARKRGILKKSEECKIVGKLCGILKKLDWIYKKHYRILCGHPPKRGLLPLDENPKRPLILCCHGVYHQGKMHSEFPKHKDVYEKQLRESIRIVQGKSYDLLIISGGYTKKDIEKSEARGMIDWAHDLGLNIDEIPLILEEYSRDSFENVLFSVCRHFEEYGQFPEKIGVCSWKSKEKRFKIIAEALKIPNYTFFGVGENEALDRAEAQQLEKIRTDPFHRFRDLASKRQRRDPWGKGNPYEKIEIFENLFRKLDFMEKKGLTDLSLVKIPWILF